ncbi:MAG TPA: hypothetical protein VHM19_22815 [Polyangiales bacterium]|jgi:hypothetical protein|nr:hypothetical protein [Polyangiales bacterium]
MDDEAADGLEREPLDLSAAVDGPASLSFKERLALLCERDDAAFIWHDPTAPAWRVGHFAVVKMPQGIVHQNATRPMLPWVVVYVPSRTVILDFATEERAWQMADEISAACGQRLEDYLDGAYDFDGDDEPVVPMTLRDFLAAVPDVIDWARDLARPALSQEPRAAVCERPFMRFAPWLQAKRMNIAMPMVDLPRGAIGDEGAQQEREHERVMAQMRWAS